MAPREFANVQELAGFVGQEATSDWLDVPQERIRQFAEATEDRQWIHLDEERAKRESPYHTTVAHGYLTLSLLPRLLATTLRVKGLRMTVNYGLNKVRFPAPVPVGSRVRARIKLESLKDVKDGVEAAWTMTVERDGGDKPCCVAETLARYYP